MIPMESTILLHICVAFFFIGSQVCHTFSKAWEVPGRTTKQYWCENRSLILRRKWLGLSTFLLIWNNPYAIDLSGLADKLGFVATLGAAGILGWFTDSVSDKVIRKLGLQGKSGGTNGSNGQ